mgnify:CR=1 FL=1
MADEPNKKMDEMLRAYAEERRKAPELYLHPATRRMLQGEVSRVTGKAEGKGSWRDRMRAFWPQIAFGGALCFVLGVAVLSLRQGPPEKTGPEENMSRPAAGVSGDPQQVRALDEGRRQAQLEGEKRLDENLAQIVAEKEQPAPRPEVPALEPAQEAVVQLGRDAESELLRRQALAESKSATAPVQSGTELTDLSLGVPVLNDREAKLEALKVDAPGEAPARGVQAELYSIVPEPPVVASDQVNSFGVELDSLQKKSLTTTATRAARPVANVNLQTSTASQAAGRGRELTNLGAARRFYFVQATNAVAGPGAPMFSSFQVEQTGKDLRVMDRDGSVYFGFIEALTNAPAPMDTAVAVTRQRLERFHEVVAKPTNSAGFNITVRGTNRTLGKDVVLTGQMFERTNAGQLPVERLSAAPAATAPVPMGARPSEPAPRMMIIGNAVVGSTNEIPVRAYSREP